MQQPPQHYALLTSSIRACSMCHSPLSACSSITLPGLIVWAIGRGQAGVPVGLNSAESLAQHDKDAGIGLLGMMPHAQGYRQTCSKYQVKLVWLHENEVEGIKGRWQNWLLR